jgi:hypothetical protein
MVIPLKMVTMSMFGMASVSVLLAGILGNPFLMKNVGSSG